MSFIERLLLSKEVIIVSHGIERGKHGTASIAHADEHLESLMLPICGQVEQDRLVVGIEELHLVDLG